MEITGTIHRVKKVVRFCLFAGMFVLSSLLAFGQKNIPKYLVKNGKMYIEINKQVRPSALDSFVTKFDLGDLE